MSNVFQRMQQLLRSQGIVGAGMVVARGLSKRPARIWGGIAGELEGKSGIEIGGPSGVFSAGGLLPVYIPIGRLDGVNFSTQTMWEGALKEGGEFKFSVEKAAGRQWVREAVDLTGVPDAGYEVLLNSHVIEHVANPLRALAEWKRVLKPGGMMVMVVPHGDGTFDRHRPLTTLAHIQEDFRKNVGEDDRTHFMEEELVDESLKLALPRDLGVDVSVGNNFVHRMWHHHVFDSLLVSQVIDSAGFTIISMEAVRPFNIIAVARKGEGGGNEKWLDAGAKYLKESPFKSDRGRKGG